MNSKFKYGSSGERSILSFQNVTINIKKHFPPILSDSVISCHHSS